MIDLKSSVMVGVARYIAEQHKKKTSHYLGELGILSEKECKEFISSIKSLQDFE